MYEVRFNSSIYVTLMVTIFLSKHYRKCQSEPTQEAEVGRKRETKAQSAKRQSESTQEAETRRKRKAEAQAAKRQSKLSQDAEKRRRQDA